MAALVASTAVGAPTARTLLPDVATVLGGGAAAEAVAHPGLRDQVARVLRVGLELAPQLGHVDPQVVRLGLVARAPHLLEQLALRDEPVLVADEHFDEVPL